MSNSSAAKMVNSWCGFTSIMPLFVAPFADAYSHNYSTIMASSFIYLAGLAALTSTAVARTSSSSSKGHKTKALPSSFLIGSLYLISLGQGGYNPSLQAFGADQVDDIDDTDEELPSSKDEDKSKKKTLFFQWWYFGICGGSLLGVTIMSYIQDTFGWVLGFAIPALSMALSILVFSAGSPIYLYKQQHHDEDDSKANNKHLINNMVKAIKHKALKCFYCGTNPPPARNKSEIILSELELQETSLCHSNLNDDHNNGRNPKRSRTCMLAQAKVVLRLLPIWTMLLMFAVIFQQPATFFTKQGMTMERTVGFGSATFKIPPATLQSAITLSIILLMPLYDRAFIPLAQILTRQDKGVSVTQRMGIGMVLSIAAMVTAALVERKRLDDHETAPLSIFWLLPQYILLGISDIFTVVGMQEFFYSEVPVRMKTMGIALYTSVFGVGSFVSAVLITLVEVVTRSQGRPSWFCDDMSEARLDNYYWLLALLSGVSLIVYVFLCVYYYHHNETSESEDEH
ncbi:Protein NRT1/ PTR FAMILY 5.8 [Senna tora]|uniref:Protein NRT1/ PTR FAMILY 5.8 n=1 Tax=Senna tora TaxID=362788 RepID=A0A834TEB2_9FABA|nr:Protein NRT1/ PTR FAMILY 5.8 [Senna tora]